MAKTARWMSLILGVLVLGYLLVGIYLGHRLLATVLTGQAFATAPAASPIPDPMIIGYQGDPATAFGLAFEEIMVPTPAGPAPAWLIPGAADAAFAAIFVHGIGGLRENGYPFLGPLRAAGIPVLLITYRKDQGAPDAPLHAFGLTEWQDLEAAVTLMVARGHSRVVIIGASMGGAITGQFLARSPVAGRVAGVVLDAPGLDLPMVMDHLLGRFGLPAPQLITPLAARAFAATHGLDLTVARAIAPIAAFPGPLLLMHGTADRIVPVDVSHRLLVQRQGGTRYLQSDGDHLQTQQRDPVGFATALNGFIAEVAAARP